MQDVNALNEARQGYVFLFLPSVGHCAGLSSQYAIRKQREPLYQASDCYVANVVGMGSGSHSRSDIEPEVNWTK